VTLEEFFKNSKITKSQMAKMLNITPQCINFYLRNGSTSLKKAIEILKLTNFEVKDKEKMGIRT
jgi:DNA-binding XRE family transcriptional regulator